MKVNKDEQKIALSLNLDQKQQTSQAKKQAKKAESKQFFKEASKSKSLLQLELEKITEQSKLNDKNEK